MRIVLTVLLMLATPSAWAEWVQYSETGRAVFYLETTTIRRDNNFRTVWEIQDLRKRDSNGAVSRMVLFEYECNLQLFRLLSVSTHSENMARGTTIYSEDSPGMWDYITADTPVAEAVRIVCDK